ncbi:MAG: putative DnaJ-class molecular chaperone withC-terminal Zn finger domain, heat shock protein [Bryobacterales bacterium]|nr:putative DnaJ-class molecular chaperone withC-terminal Zn finger domain, heat shock protein [Bryobacterales bacterium]
MLEGPASEQTLSRNAYPLSWPEGWKREKSRRSADFGKVSTDYSSGQARYAGKKRLSVSDAVQRVLGELQRMGVGQDDVLISTNAKLRLDGFPRSDQEPGDPGAAVYWQKKGQQMRCMAIDRYQRVADNLAAIAATLEAMRAIERHGGAAILDRAFTGFAALPERASQSWREVLGIPLERLVNLDVIEERFRALIKVHHPDQGGDRERFEAIVAAREAARQEVA